MPRNSGRETLLQVESQKMLLRVTTATHFVEKSTFFSFFSKIRGQFYQHFMCSFYMPRSQKRKKDSQLKQLYKFLESAGVKAAQEHVDEFDPRWEFMTVVADTNSTLLPVKLFCLKITRLFALPKLGKRKEA